MVGGGCARAVVCSIQPPRRQIAGVRARSRERVGSRRWKREGKKRKDREASDRDTVFAARRPLPRVYTSLRKRDSARAARRIKKGERVLRPLDY